MAVPSLLSHSASPTHTQHFMSHAVKIPRGWCKDEVLESSLVKNVQGAFSFSPFLLSVNGSYFQATVYSTRARFFIKTKIWGYSMIKVRPQEKYIFCIKFLRMFLHFTGPLFLQVSHLGNTHPAPPRSVVSCTCHCSEMWLFGWLSKGWLSLPSLEKVKCEFVSL